MLKRQRAVCLWLWENSRYLVAIYKCDQCPIALEGFEPSDESLLQSKSVRDCSFDNIQLS